MIPAVLGLTAWIAKGVVLTALPRLLKAVTDRCLPTPKTSPTPPVRLNQAVPQLRNRAIVYAYDNLSQLVGVNINQTPAASFQFDQAGNLQSLTLGNTTSTFTHNQLNQRTTPGTNVYDSKGQTTDKDGRTFEWDDDGRMTAIVDGTHRSEMAYDGYGRRIKIAEFDNGTLTSKKLYWWLGGQIVCERDGITPGFPILKRYFGQGVVVGAERLYYTMDQLGSVRELVDSTGVVRSDYRYTPYGERTKVGGDLESDFGYGGLFHHAPSGLDLATYRTYDSKMGRWISRDPLGESAGLNLYAYCNNNPISCVDPAGLEAGILHSDGSYTQYAGTAAGWSEFVSDVQNAAPGSISDLYVMGHGGTTGIYPERFPQDNARDSYIWHNTATDQLRLGYTKDGKHYDVPLERLGLHRLGKIKLHLKGCNTGATVDNLNLTLRLQRSMRRTVQIIGSPGTFWFRTEIEQLDLRVQPIASPYSVPGMLP